MGAVIEGTACEGLVFKCGLVAEGWVDVGWFWGEIG